jgi:4-alpha-glucanotransferase
MTYKKTKGVLLPVSALPGASPTGDLDGAAEFIIWLKTNGFSTWQILPLSPPDIYGSPYSSWSSFAGYPAYVGLRWLASQGLLETETPQTDELWVDHKLTSGPKLQSVLNAAERLVHNKLHPLYEQMAYFGRSSPWARQAAMFSTRKERHNNKHWWQWPANESFENREEDLSPRETVWLAAFFLFDAQYSEIKAFAASHHVEVIGDLPLYPAHDSADVWANQDLFQLEDNGQCLNIAGAPPDDHFKNGQVWGNPLYEWPCHEKDGYSWWLQRINRALQLYDRLRLDHFIGFSRYWSIPAKTDLIDSANGQWISAPGRDLFEKLLNTVPPHRFIAEDLGSLDDATIALRDRYNLAGTKVALFGFQDDMIQENPHRLENLQTNSILYSSTHDTDTIKGWWETMCEQDRSATNLGSNREEAHLELMNRIEKSRAGLVIYQFQDLLGLGSEGRMNTPGTTIENWRWRLGDGDLHYAERAVTLLHSQR